MTRWPDRKELPTTASALGTVSEARLHRLVVRACRHTYGADAALRAGVRRAVIEMIAAGATPDAIRRAVAQCLEKHPNAVPDKPSLVTGESGAASVLKRMLSWTDDALADAGVREAM